MNWKNGVLIGLLLLLTVFLLGWQLSPRVAAFDPVEEQLRGRQPLKITFTRSLDADSLPPAFLLDPEIEGELSWEEDLKTLVFTPEVRWPPGETITLQLGRGVRSIYRLPLLGRFTHSWSIRPTSLIYLWPADGTSNLYQVDPASGESQALTELASGVLDYSISPDGERVFFSTTGEDGSSLIISLNPAGRETQEVLECTGGFCTAPRLSTDGNLLAFEYIAREAGIQPGVRVLDLTNGELSDLGSPDEHLEEPRWSSAGWLSAYNRTAKGYRFWNPRTDKVLFIPNETGGEGSWSPDGRYFLCSEIVFVSDTLAPRHLMLIDLVEETVRDLSRGSFLEDLNPRFAPVGNRFAFSRKSLDPQEWTPGRQLWVMDLESETAFRLTDQVDYQHTSFAWHPAGDQLAYVRYNQAALSEPPEIWLIQASGEDPLRLIINGFAPGWIP